MKYDVFSGGCSSLSLGPAIPLCLWSQWVWLCDRPHGDIFTLAASQSKTLFLAYIGLGFIAAPTDTCVPSAQTAQFNCSTVAQIASMTVTAGQEWTITTPGGGSVTYSAPSISILPVLPAAYVWIVDSSGVAVLTGLRVLSADISLNDTTFQCIALFGGERNASAPAATLEVAGIKLHISLVVRPLYQRCCSTSRIISALLHGSGMSHWQNNSGAIYRVCYNWYTTESNHAPCWHLDLDIRILMYNIMLIRPGCYNYSL